MCVCVRTRSGYAEWEDERVAEGGIRSRRKQVQRAKRGDGGGSIITDLNNLGAAEEWQRPDRLS